MLNWKDHFRITLELLSILLSMESIGSKLSIKSAKSDFPILYPGLSRTIIWISSKSTTYLTQIFWGFIELFKLPRKSRSHIQIGFNYTRVLAFPSQYPLNWKRWNFWQNGLKLKKRERTYTFPCNYVSREFNPYFDIQTFPETFVKNISSLSDYSLVLDNSWWSCDCSKKNILSLNLTGLSVTCRVPFKLKGRDFASLAHSDLTCSYPKDPRAGPVQDRLDQIHQIQTLFFLQKHLTSLCVDTF